ncbi:FecR family protein [Novosphingobium terrae]|uniref:FecR family protein n=1 Tax=Novosphingobium terrae TaxID=2726189 RepID=UPI00197DF63C|nr:FecR domain-containing protein [Novosphingobium terrae]
MDAELSLHHKAAEWFVMLREEPDDQALRAAFDRWLAQSADHREAWDSVELTFAGLEDDLLGSAPIQPGPPLVPAPAWLTRRGRIGGFAGFALAACLALAIAPHLQLRLQADAITGAGEMKVVALDRGDAVRLGPESAIALEERAGTRTVHLLAGEAWFDIRHDPSRRFTVKAGDVTTTDIGTAFDVRLLGSTTVVSVANGEVQVDRPASVPYRMTAGQWLRVPSVGGAQTGTVNPRLAGPWRNGRVVATDRTIAEVIDEIRPWYSGHILLSDKALGQRRVSGSYDAKAPADAIEALVNPYGGRVTRITPWLLIVSQ